VPEFLRSFVPGGTFFFTVVTAERSPFLCEPNARSCLRAAFHACRARWPFEIVAIVLVPDHLHAMWTLPGGDSEYSRRWAFLKRCFTERWLATGGTEANATPGWSRQRRRGVWQPRFWEHAIRDETDLERHVEYILYNPVKHGLCCCPGDWPYSSFERFVKRGDYDAAWGRAGTSAKRMDFSDIASTAHE
jgi:putative transposase